MTVLVIVIMKKIYKDITFKEQLSTAANNFGINARMPQEEALSRLSTLMTMFNELSISVEGIRRVEESSYLISIAFEVGRIKLTLGIQKWLGAHGLMTGWQWVRDEDRGYGYSFGCTNHVLRESPSAREIARVYKTYLEDIIGEYIDKRTSLKDKEEYDVLRQCCLVGLDMRPDFERI